jgi:hypothetical protein
MELILGIYGIGALVLLVLFADWYWNIRGRE